MTASALMLTGCTFGTSIDNLMAPPKLSVEQEQIYSALTDVEGPAISLKYPKSGRYLSAFIFADIDGDESDEAVVFYEKNTLSVEENPLRIGILDRDDGNWRSVCSTPADGTEIERVMISQLGENDRVNLIIGSSLINRSEKTVSIYNYSNGGIERNFSAGYSFMDVTDMDKNDQNELLLLIGSTAGGGPASAEAYQLDGEGMYHQYRRDLSGSFSEFDSLNYGEINGGLTGLYIDAASGTGFIQTDVIYLDSTGLNKVFANPETSLATVRPAGCNSLDVDGDGRPEIPVQTIFPGYEDVSESEQMKLTNWMTINSKGRLERKYSSYYNINDGYIFIFPEKWRNKVTVRRDTINDEIVFCAYEDGSAGRELIRIYYAGDSASREDRISSGYMLLRTKGDSACLAYLPPAPDVDDGLSITAGEAAIGFIFKE